MSEASNPQMSKVQRELLELRGKGTVNKHKDKFKDYDTPLTTPEEAQAFLAAMRDKSRAQSIPTKPPTHLSADGIDDWFLQQRKREQEMKARRKEAEALLRGYRASYEGGGGDVGGGGSEIKPRKISQEGDDDDVASKGADNNDTTEGARTIGKIQISSTDHGVKVTNEPSAHGGEKNQDRNEEDEKKEDEDAAVKEEDDKHKEEEENEGKTAVVTTLDDVISSPSEIESAKAEPPQETEEWRHFVEQDSTSRFPAEKGRYHLFASYACPGSHRVLIVRALKGLTDVVGVTIVHPVWRLTKSGTAQEQRGWVFGDPNGEPFENTAGRGGPFPPCYEDNEPNPFFESASVRDIYERVGDKGGKYTVPFLWDTKEGTIVNNDSSEIAYMLNSSFDKFAANPALDLYTKDNPDLLNGVVEWLSPLMIHGVYKCGFAKRQESYDSAIKELTAAFDRADQTLQKQRYLTGESLTDADIRLFVSLIRFDEVYAFYFKTNSRLVCLTPSLLNFCRDVYQMDGIAGTCKMEQIKAHFFASHAEWNKFSVIPAGLGFMKLLDQPHDRDLLGDRREGDGSVGM